jgi:hypothetical protein
VKVLPATTMSWGREARWTDVYDGMLVVPWMST